MNLNIIEPNYFKDFHCIGGQCKQNCCSCCWKIEFNKKDYLTAKNAKKSKELQELCTHAFRRIKKSNNPNVYAEMRLNESGSCHFLGEDGLCKLQQECGYKVLPGICKKFPRQYFVYLNTFEQYLSTGCEEVVRLLMNLPGGIELTNGLSIGDNNSIQALLAIQTPEAASTVPFKYYWDIKTLLISIMKNRNYSFEDRLILLGIAFKHIDELIAANNGDKIPAYIDGLIAACADDKSMLDDIRDIETKTNQNAINFASMLQTMTELNTVPKYFSNKIELAYGIVYGTTEGNEYNTIQISHNKVEKQLGYLFNMLSGREFIFENIMLNAILHLNLPFTDTNMSFWESYIFFCQIYSMMVFMVAGNLTETSNDDDIIEAFVISSRALLHNKILKNKIMEFIKEHKSTTLGSMVYLIKF
ncbi:MAG: flagellin lysine-N-methylase [Oscillospiraceae bacterium]|nr:flagellin lysine-N-methylase [Oscillospiraceae bacterium]